MKLLRSQRNQLFDWIVKEGLSPVNLKITENKSLSLVSITYLKTGFYFKLKISFSNNKLYVDRVFYSPAQNSLHTELMTMSPWEGLIPHLQNWILYLLREVEQPNKWQQVIDSSEKIKLSFENEDNRPFSIEEFRQIEIAIEQVKVRSKEIGMSQTQYKILTAKLDYISEKAKTMGQIDWKNLFIGTLIGTIVQLSLPSNASQQLWMLIKEAFSQFFILLVP